MAINPIHSMLWKVTNFVILSTVQERCDDYVVDLLRQILFYCVVISLHAFTTTVD